MNIFRYFESLFPPPQSQASADKRQAQFRQKLVASYARGNASLQNGRFVTSQQIAEKKAALRKHNF